MAPSNPVLSVVILSFNTQSLTRACLHSLLSEEPVISREIIVVDNASHDGSVEMIKQEFPSVRLIQNPRNELYSMGNNIGAKEARGDYLCILNSDTEVRPGALDTLVQFLKENQTYGVVGPKFVFLDGRIQHSVNRFPNLLLPIVQSLYWLFPRTLRKRVIDHVKMASFDHLTSQDVDQPMGACLVMSRYEFLDMGGFDPQLSLFFNDVDLCQKFWRKKRRIRYLVDAEVAHHQGASTSRLLGSHKIWQQNRITYYKKTCGFFGGFLVRLATYIFNVGVKLSEKKKSLFENKACKK